MSRLSAPALAILLLSAVFNPTQAQQPRSTLIEHLDSSDIRMLPLSRSTEIASFLPGTQLGLGYNALVSGSLGKSEIKIDGVTAPALLLPAHAISAVDANLFGASVSLSEPTAIQYSTLRTTTRPSGYARGASDQGMPGSIGLTRFEAGARMPLLSSLHFAFDVAAQNADQSEFNNYSGVPIYRAEGIDSVIRYDPVGNGDTRSVAVPKFVLSDEKVPTSGWSELLGTARLDLVRSTNSNWFVSAYYSRYQQRTPFGNAGCSTGCSLYNAQAQRGDRALSTLFTLGIDQHIGAGILHGRLAHIGAQQTSGVLLPGDFAFFVDDQSYPVDQALVNAVLTNDANHSSPFPTSRTDLNPSQEFRMNPYAIFNTFSTRGVAAGHYVFSDDSRLYGSASYELRHGAHHASVGGKVTSFDLRYVDTGYNQVSSTVWVENPLLLALYGEDEIRAGTAVAVIGLRFDRYDARTSYARTAGATAGGAGSFVEAAAKSALSPRLAVAVPLDKLIFRAAYGRYARIPDFTQQFNGKNADFFSYHNISATYIFNDQALDLIGITAANVGAEYRISHAASVAATVFSNEAQKLPQTERLAFEDPHNPGSSDYLNVVRSDGKQKDQGLTALGHLRLSQRLTASAGVTREKLTLIQQLPSSVTAFGSGSTTSISTSTSITGITGLLEGHTNQLGGLDATLALRARSPSNSVTLEPVSFIADTTRSAWLLRADARIAKSLSVGGLHGEVWLDALRFAGSSQYLPIGNAATIASGVQSSREVLGGGGVRSNINLTSVASAGSGVRNAVDLALLQQAEQRFGNGDLQFSAEEQIAAFTAAERLKALAGTPLSPSRRLQLGVSISF